MTILADPVRACSCARPESSVSRNEVVRGVLADSEAVFAGEVVRIEGPPPQTIMSSGDPETVTFRVSEVWKGQVGETSSVTTAESSASCGYPFNEESSYLVYVSEGGQVGLCGSTKLLSEADADLKVLGDGIAPAESDLPETFGGSSDYFIVSLSLITVGVSLWLGVRRSSSRR